MIQAILLVLPIAAFPACSRGAHDAAPAQAPAKPPKWVDRPPATPPGNPLTPEKVALGKTLFFDPRLSKSGKTSCESCHLPEKGWTDGLPLSKKDDGSMNTRHSPTLLNAALFPDLYWDGRAAGLEAQILAAWKAQMSGDPDAVAKALEGVAGYKDAFEKAFGGPPTGERIVQALASFVRTLLSEDTPWDRREAGEADAVSAEVVEGFRVFSEVANCALCHVPPLYSDTLFHNVGVGFDREKPDFGRGKHLADAAAKEGKPAPAEAETLKGAFKTPSLRAVTETAPYLHDGRFATLEEVADFMLKGGIPNPHLDAKLKPKSLSAKERAALLAFVRSLSAPSKGFERPTIP